MINRPTYLDSLENIKDKQIIKVLTGVRRCGKSTILEMFQEKLRASGVAPQQIQSYNFEDYALSDFLDVSKMHARITSQLVGGEMNYIFLDEIQRINGFEKLLDSLFIRKNIDLYVTGSNAFMLSGELATLLSGRYIEIHIFPFSFKEFYQNQDKEAHLAFQDYLDKGGFPFTLQLADDKAYRDYLDGIVNTVLIKDVLSRRQRSDTTLAEELARFLADTAGSLVTVKKISDTLTSLGQKTTPDTVSSYLSAFQEAFLFYRCDRYDIAGKKYLSINSKYYPVDQGLRVALIGNRRPNIGHRLETIVYLEYLRRGYEVYVGNIQGGEVDFVANKNGIKEYCQVSETLKNEATYQREIAPFMDIKDNYRKILLTEDLGNYDDNGIVQTNVVDWLLGEE